MNLTEKVGKNNHVYATITQQLNSEGIGYTQKKVRDKINGLKAQYQKEKTHHGGTGSTPSTWKYYKDMQKFFCDTSVVIDTPHDSVPSPTYEEVEYLQDYEGTNGLQTDEGQGELNEPTDNISFGDFQVDAQGEATGMAGSSSGDFLEMPANSASGEAGSDSAGPNTYDQSQTASGSSATQGKKTPSVVFREQLFKLLAETQASEKQVTDNLMALMQKHTAQGAEIVQSIKEHNVLIRESNAIAQQQNAILAMGLGLQPSQNQYPQGQSAEPDNISHEGESEETEEPEYQPPEP